MDSRECGKCTLCCTFLAVADKALELDTPAGKQCSKVCGSGCGIYDRRPLPCRTFDCLWLKGLFPEEMRPDTLGVVVHAAPLRINSYLRLFWIVTEATPDTTPKEIIDTLREFLVGEEHLPIILGPPGFPKGAVQILWPRLESWEPVTIEDGKIGC